MSLLTGTPITFSTAMAKSAILEPAFAKPLLQRIFTIYNGMVTDQQIAFIGRISKVSKLDTGCGSAPVDHALPLSEKTWDPSNIEAWVKQCATDLEQTFLVWGLAKGYEKYDLSKAKMGDDPQGFWDEFVMDMMTDAAFEDLLRILFLGDKNILAGALTAGAGDVPNYNQVNGIWKQVFADAAIRKYTITANAGVSTTAQDTLAADLAIVAMRSLLNNADPRLTSEPDAMFLVTKSIADNFADYRESNNNIETSWAQQLSGPDSAPRYRGVPIISLDFLDRYIRADFKPDAVYDRPHRILLTTKSNLVAGFDSYDASAANGNFESWYERKEKEMHMRGNYKLDVKLMRNYLAAAAY